MSPPLKPVMSTKLSQGEIDRIERFEAAFNAIDQHFHKILRKTKKIPFSEILREFTSSKKYLPPGEAEYLRMIGDLRNCIVHEKTKPYQYVAVPTSEIVDHLEEIQSQLKNPEIVIPKFKKEVETVSLLEPITDVLKRVSDKDYSQFPVYEGSKFEGLLTENGITRWLAHHVTEKLSLIELSEVTVREVLGEEEKRGNWKFVSRNTTVHEVKDLFPNNELLEAVLITESGNAKEKLLGIITRWDVIQIK